jgi:hypothetical protein
LSVLHSLSLEEYRYTSYENPDPEYVDGALLARGLSDYPHSKAHARIGGLFWELECWGIQHIWLIAPPLWKPLCLSPREIE